MYRVLLVEDDAAMRFIYGKMTVWTECGFTIAQQASNGKQALDILKKEKFDLIFTDVRMPFMDGIELLREIRQSKNDTNVIFSSSYNEFEYARQGLILGAFDYILKPVEEKKLAEVLSRVKEKIESEAETVHIEDSVAEILTELGHPPCNGKFIVDIAEYFSAHYGKTVTIEDISEKFGYNKDYFGKMFRKQIGIPFSKFCSMNKIAYAKDLIRTGNYKFYEIGEILGYSSTDYFVKIFKEIAGMTPSAYKASLEESSDNSLSVRVTSRGQ